MVLNPSSVLELHKDYVLSHVQLFVTPWTVAYQAPLSMEFSRQEYWSELPFPSPELQEVLQKEEEEANASLQTDKLDSLRMGSGISCFKK